MGQEFLCLGADGHLDGGHAGRTRSLERPIAAGGHGAGRGETLQRVEVVAQRIDEFAGGELLQQAHCQQLADEGPRVVDAHISRVHLALPAELQAVGQQTVYGATRKVVGEDALLDGLDQKLRDLRGSQLVPGEGGLALLEDDDADGMGRVVDGETVCGW